MLRQQHQIVARRQVVACELSENAIRHRLRPGGPWQVVLPGVYACGQGKLSEQQRAVAAFLYAGRAIAVTGLSAIAWHGVPVKGNGLVDVLVPVGHRRSDAGFVRLLRTSVTPRIDCRDGVISYTPLDRAIVDAARELTDLADVRELVASAVQRGKVEISQLTMELAASRTAGSARLRLVLAEVADGVRSVAEADLRAVILRSSLPTPLYNASLFAGGKFLAQPDAWWPAAGVVAEVDSRQWHLSPESWQRTLQRSARMTAQGILVLHFTPAEIRSDRRAVVARIRSALAASRGPLPRIETRPLAGSR